jgi:type IV pilus assembly protein PilQ
VDKPSTSNKSTGGGGGADSSSIVSVVQSVLSENGRLQVDPYTNSLVITDLPENFGRVTEVINELDVLTPQVHIDAQVLEVDASKAQTAGVNWGNGQGILASLVGPARAIQWPTGLNSGQVLPNASDLAGSAASPPGAYGIQSASGTSYGIIDLTTLTATLQLLQTEGASKILSQPSIMVLNNSPAVVSVTAETAIGVESAASLQTSATASQAERSTTGLTLKVTPQVNDDEYITLLVELTNTQPEQSKFFPNQFVDPTTASAATKVRVRDGQTLIIGGLTTTETTKTVSRVPILGSIPLLDMIFASTSETETKEDLILMITPKRAE